MRRRLVDLLRGGERGPEDSDEPTPERCLSCDADLEGSATYSRYRVCHACGFHSHLSAKERISLLVDPGTFHEADRGVTALDPLSFDGRGGYRSRVINAQRRTGLSEAVLTGSAAVRGRQVEVAAVDFGFLGGSIGVAAGERLARVFEKATARKIPVITIASTSGTRMQEGLLALMQAPRIAIALRRHARAGLPYIAIATDPTTGSAYSGFVSLADFILAEPNALMGYSALRLLEEAAGQELPPGAHTAEDQLAHGLIDAVVPRQQLRGTVATLLDIVASEAHVGPQARSRADQLAHTPHDAWSQVQISRHQNRPTAVELARLMTTTFFQIHGDRSGTDDAAIATGPAMIGNEPVMLVVQSRTADAGGTVIGPAGYRKGRRAMLLAEKFRLPLVTLIDTMSADPALSSEEAGLGPALAACMTTMLDLTVPTIAAIVGEATSEGAMALAVADRVLMLDNAVYEVVRPEQAARLLSRQVDELAERLRITSHDCLRLGIADATVQEPGEGAHTHPGETALYLQRAIVRELGALLAMREKRRIEERFTRYREIGSTRTWVRGTIERRLAHLADRLAALRDRLRPSRRPRRDSLEHPEIPV